MNKLVKLLFALVLTFTLTFGLTSKNTVSAASSNKNKVTLYMFRRTGCSHCYDELKYLDTIFNEYKDKIKIVIYEVNAGSNSSLYADVTNELNYTEGGVPITVIGKDYLVGFGSGMEEELLEKINTAYDKQSEDLVAGVMDDNVYDDLQSTDLYEAMEEEGIEITSKKTKQNNIIPIIVFGSIIIGLSALVYYSRKK